MALRGAADTDNKEVIATIFGNTLLIGTQQIFVELVGEWHTKRSTPGQKQNEKEKECRSLDMYLYVVECQQRVGDTGAQVAGFKFWLRHNLFHVEKDTESLCTLVTPSEKQEE